jgi:predicted RNA methylase
MPEPGITAGARAGRCRWLWRRCAQLRATHGIATAITVLPLIVWQAIFGEDRDRRWPDPSGRAFDVNHGVDTTGIIPLAALDVAEPSWVYGFDYQPVELVDFTALLAPFAIDTPATVFIDLGAGKGRVMMLASALPFKRIIGVEIAAELARIAVTNVSRYTQAQGSPTPWEIVRADAGEYRFPDSPLVIFMYNPFTAPIMRRVIDHLLASRDTVARRVIVIYVRPELDDMWAAAPGFREVARSDRYRIYESP